MNLKIFAKTLEFLECNQKLTHHCSCISYIMNLFIEEKKPVIPFGDVISVFSTLKNPNKPVFVFFFCFIASIY